MLPLPPPPSPPRVEQLPPSEVQKQPPPPPPPPPPQRSQPPQARPQAKPKPNSNNYKWDAAAKNKLASAVQGSLAETGGDRPKWNKVLERFDKRGASGLSPRALKVAYSRMGGADYQASYVTPLQGLKPGTLLDSHAPSLPCLLPDDRPDSLRLRNPWCGTGAEED